jgi:hypothetical protein
MMQQKEMQITTEPVETDECHHSPEPRDRNFVRKPPTLVSNSRPTVFYANPNQLDYDSQAVR